MRIHHIEITGVDDHVTPGELDELKDVLQLYPHAELGVLMKASAKVAEPRYPSIARIRELRERGFPLACHLSGAGWLGAICSGESPLDVELGGFPVVQLNIGRSSFPVRHCPSYLTLVERTGVERVAEGLYKLLDPAVVIVLQVYPLDPKKRIDPIPSTLLTLVQALRELERSVRLLFDPSGGRKRFEPSRWPEPPEDFADLVGYTGGLQPDTQVRAQVLSRLNELLVPLEEKRAGAIQVWLGAESGLRDDSDCLELGKVRAFLDMWRDETLDARGISCAHGPAEKDAGPTATGTREQ